MHTRTLRTVALLGVLMLIGAVAIVIVHPPANQYEISMYRVYPSVFWLLVVGAMFLGTVVIAGSVQESDDRSWAFGFLLVLKTNALILLLPFIRGYQMYGRGDALTHVGFVRDIAASGGIGDNFYPPTHFLVLAISDATGLDIMMIGMFIPVLFSGLYFGGLFYLLIYLFNSKEQVLFGLPFVMLPVLRLSHVGFRPFDLSVMFVPIVLYLFVKAQRNPTPSNRATFVVSLFAFITYHPLTALFLVITFALYVLARYVPTFSSQYEAPTNLSSLAAALFLVWYSNFTGIVARSNRVFNALSGRTDGGAPVETYSQTVQETSPALIDLARVAIFRYGTEFALFSLIFVYLSILLLLLLYENLEISSYTVMFVSMVGVFGSGAVFFLLADLIVPIDRPLQIAKIGAVVLAGQLFFFVWFYSDTFRGEFHRRTAFSPLLMIVLLLLIILSVFTIYPAPSQSLNNHQVTEMEVDGTNWLTEHGNSSNQLLEFDINYFRFYQSQHGTERTLPFTGTIPPAHFNYTEHSYIGQNYDSDRYLTVTRRGRILYPEGFPKYPENWRFTPEDFDRLDADRTTNRLYDNGDYNQYLINGSD